MDTSSKDIRRQAADWVVTLQEGTATEGELRRFREWLLQSPVHVGAYLKAEAAWLALRQVDGERRIDIDSLLRSPANVVPLRLDMPVEYLTQREGSTRPPEWRWQRWHAAAGFAVATLAGVLLWSILQSGTTLQTALGEQHTTLLEDGSVVELNTQSVLRVRYSADERRVDVNAGEAFFNVREDASRPFVVVVEDHRIKAVGTGFNVYRKPDRVVVTVAEGIVELTVRADSAGEPMRISAGQQAVVAAGRAVLAAADSDPVGPALAWRNSQLVCIEEPLASVIEEMNRYNERKLIISDEQLMTRRVNGVFSVHNPELIVRFLELSAAVRVEEGADGSWLLSGDAPPEIL